MFVDLCRGIDLGKCARPFSDPPSTQGISEGMETSGKIRHIEVTENSLFYCRRATSCSTRAHTHTHTQLHLLRCRDTTERFEWIKFSCLSLTARNHQNSVRPVSPEFRVEDDWLKCATPQTHVNLLASRYPFCHTIPANLILAPRSFNSGF
jgi:hypothetical protein